MNNIIDWIKEFYLDITAWSIIIGVPLGLVIIILMFYFERRRHKRRYNMKQKQNNNIPKIGKEYHFFDNGKKSPSRHYICKCERIVTPEEAKAITFNDVEITLYDIWKDESSRCNWLFAKDTDYFVEVSCPKYDNNNLWAVRTKDGGWFTLDVQTGWQGGRIDVTGEIFDNVVEFWTKEGEMGMVDGYLEETYN